MNLWYILKIGIVTVHSVIPVEYEKCPPRYIYILVHTIFLDEVYKFYNVHLLKITTYKKLTVLKLIV